MNRANALVIAAVVALAGVAVASSLGGRDAAPPAASPVSTGLTATRDDDTVRGLAIDRVSLPGHSALYPHVVTGPDGTVTAVWERYDGRSLVVQAATRSAGKEWSRPVDVSRQLTDPGVVDVAVGGDGVVTVVWAAPGLTVARLHPGDRAWPVPETIASVGPASSFAVAATATGLATIVWSDVSAVRQIVDSATAAPGSDAWNVGMVHALVGDETPGPFFAAASHDSVTVGWLLQRHGLCVGAQSATIQGKGWVVADVLRSTATDGTCGAVAVAGDDAGHLVLGWQERGFRVVVGAAGRWGRPAVVGSSTGDLIALAGVAIGADGQADLLVERNLEVEIASRTAQGTWSGLIPIKAGTDLTANENPQLAPRLAVAPSGSGIVVWMAQDRARRPVIRIVTRNGYRGAWATPVSIPAGPGLHDVQVSLAPDGRTATVVWQTAAMPGFTGLLDQPDGVLESLAVHMPSPPAISDPAPGVAVSDVSLPGRARNPLVVAGTDGVTTALWGERDGAGTVLHAAVRSSDGGWSAPVPISELDEEASGAQLVTSPDGSVTAVWLGSRLFAARRAAGSTRWSPRVALAPFYWTPGSGLVATGSGRVTVVWVDGGLVRARSLLPGARRWSGVATISRSANRAWVESLVAFASGRDRVTVVWSERRDAACVGVFIARSGLSRATTRISASIRRRSHRRRTPSACATCAGLRLTLQHAG